MVLYSEQNLGKKRYTSVDREDSRVLRDKFGPSVHLISGELDLQSQRLFGQNRAVVSFESPRSFSTRFAPRRTPWIQVQSGGDLVVNIASEPFRADGYALMGPSWLGRELALHPGLLPAYSAAISEAARLPSRIIGSPRLFSMIQNNFADVATQSSGPKNITIFEPNLVPKSFSPLLDYANLILFELGNRSTLTQTRAIMSEIALQARMKGLDMESRVRPKTRSVRLFTSLGESPEKIVSGLSPLQDMLKSAAVVSFLPSFSIWEALYANVPPIVIEANDLFARSGLRSHPQQVAFSIIDKTLDHSLMVSSVESARAWFPGHMQVGGQNYQSIVSPWLSREESFMLQIYSLAEELKRNR